MAEVPRRVRTAATLLRIARGTTVLACLTLLAVFASEIARSVPGPDVTAAAVLAMLVGATIASVHLAFSVPLRAALDRPDAPMSAGREISEAVFANLMFVLGAMLLWVALDLTGTLFVIPAITIGLGVLAELVLERSVSSHRLDEPMVERRLARFAREVGLGAVEVRVATHSGRSSRVIAPDVSIYGTTIEVPPALVDAGYDVLETRLANAVVKLRRRRYIGDQALRSIVLAILLIAAAPAADDLLLSLSGAANVADPAFLPAATVLIASMGGVGRRIEALRRRSAALRLVRATLDLTRNPEGILRSMEYDLERGAVDEDAGPLHRLISSTPAATQVRAEVDAWLASRRLCMLFTDIVGSTDALEQLGDERWDDILFEHDEVVRRRAREFGGEEIHKAGDGFLIVFPQSGQAALAASEMQRDLETLRMQGRMPVTVRMGLHTGEMIRRGIELVGREVNLAARIGGAADGGEILVSEAVRAELASAVRFRFGPVRDLDLKGFTEHHEVRPLLWTDEARDHP